jgi:four helix bundle protein
MSHSYRDLLVWQKAMDLVEAIYPATSTFPKQELYGLVSQMRRAAVSIVSNIAEGQGRLTPGEFRQFLGTARGSLLELDATVNRGTAGVRAARSREHAAGVIQRDQTNAERINGINRCGGGKITLQVETRNLKLET